MVTHDNRREATGLYLATIEVVTSLAERAEVIAALADRRVALVREDDAPGAKERARQLRDHVRAYVIPRARALESPLLVVLLGPTGAGKSTLMNTLARATVSRTGVLRPTTREAVLLATDADAAVLRRGAGPDRCHRGRSGRSVRRTSRARCGRAGAPACRRARSRSRAPARARAARSGRRSRRPRSASFGSRGRCRARRSRRRGPPCDHREGV